MIYLLILNFIVVIFTISYGFVKKFKSTKNGQRKLKRIFKFNLVTFVPIMCASILFNIPNIVKAASTSSGIGSSQGMGYIAAALCTGLATIGAGYAVGAVGSSALGAISEDSSVLGKTLIYVGLAEGIAIYGLIISIMILSRL